MSDDLARLAAQCRTFSGQLRAAQKAGAQKAGRGLADRVEVNTRAVAAAGVLSGVGRAGAKVGAKVDTLKAGTVLVKVTGPYQLIERDTKAHREPRARRAGGRRALLIPGVGYRRSVQHPGTKGKHPFERAVNQYGPQVPKVFQAEVHSAMARTFR
jgi:hypothetical protein